MTDQSKQLIEFIADMKEEEATALANEMLDSGYDPVKLLDHCRQAMEIVGKRFESGEYFLPELMLAGEMLTQIGNKAKPLIKETQAADNHVGHHEPHSIRSRAYQQKAEVRNNQQAKANFYRGPDTEQFIGDPAGRERGSRTDVTDLRNHAGRL